MSAVITLAFAAAGVLSALATAWLPAALYLSVAVIWWALREEGEQ